MAPFTAPSPFLDRVDPLFALIILVSVGIFRPLISVIVSALVAPRKRLANGCLDGYRDLICFFAARSLRSFAVGYLGIILPIYITDLGYDAIHLGMLFSISGITGALLAVCVGVLSDRFGRKRFIIAIALMMAVGVVGLALTTNFALMVAAAAFGTIGFPGGVGGGGGWGPYYPAAQSWLLSTPTTSFARQFLVCSPSSA